jgi:hypothetical protein
MSHDAITLIASLSVIASLHLSFALRAHIKRTTELMSHDAITLIASLSVIASLHLSFALRAHIKRTPVLAAIDRTEWGDPKWATYNSAFQMTRLPKPISAWYDYEAGWS